MAYTLLVVLIVLVAIFLLCQVLARMQQQVLRRQLQQLQQQVLMPRRQLRLFQQAQLSNNQLIRKSGIFAFFYPFILEKRMEKDEKCHFF